MGGLSVDLDAGWWGSAGAPLPAQGDYKAELTPNRGHLAIAGIADPKARWPVAPGKSNAIRRRGGAGSGLPLLLWPRHITGTAPKSHGAKCEHPLSMRLAVLQLFCIIVALLHARR